MVEFRQPDIKQQVFIDTIVPVHPEHYVLPANNGGIVENVGEHITRVHIRSCANPLDFVKAYADPSYQHLPAIGTLEDGSVLLYILQEIKILKKTVISDYDSCSLLPPFKYPLMSMLSVVLLNLEASSTLHLN